jgi:hypothetical protein
MESKAGTGMDCERADHISAVTLEERCRAAIFAAVLIQGAAVSNRRITGRDELRLVPKIMGRHGGRPSRALVGFA